MFSPGELYEKSSVLMKFAIYTSLGGIDNKQED